MSVTEHKVYQSVGELVADTGSPELMRAYLKLEPTYAPEWQPIETAPKDGRLLLLFAGELCEMQIGYFVYPDWKKPDSLFGIRITPTHWMALPEPPK